MALQKMIFGQTAEGKRVDLYTLTNSGGMEVKITTYGATVVSLVVPDRNGKPADVVLGFDSLEDYIRGGYYFGKKIEIRLFTMLKSNGHKFCPSLVHPGIFAFVDPHVKWEIGM